MATTRIGIIGYGNLGHGIEQAAHLASDIETVAVFTRRDPASVQTVFGAPVHSMDDLESFVGKIDVMVLGGGSATDLPEQTPEIAKLFNVVDSFDTHANIPTHFANVDAAAKAAGNIGIISVGWDPGMFSVTRLYANCILPQGNDYTFWGRGVSQGHSDAIRRIDGVVDARQFTVPVESAVASVRNGENPTFTTRQMHTRECFVVAEEGADQAAIEKEIVEMPNYFSDYDTTVNFISQEELDANYAGLPHGGMVMRTGHTDESGNQKHVIEYKLTLDSNPAFTGSIMIAFARAANTLAGRGNTGCFTIFDIAPADLSPLSGEEMRSHLL